MLPGNNNATGWVDGTGGTVRFRWPQAVAADRAGSLYVADSDNHAVRMGVPSAVGPPNLQIAWEAYSVILTWPLSVPAFMLQTRANVTAGGAWTPLTDGLAVVGDNFVLTNNITAQNAYYRLLSP